ncbi:3-oxoacyl-[acyl-carrier protein] reductase [Flavobacterium arsenatis]|uniref:3-oxoacyl-[acyl-carrier protein] reductase n=1 Tax=Flavobacterium arsenatis TaxID=1484332 RepID=A0ABU1TMY1_9FLAO|nr:SDR family oxidoreductase [Flavobacterium arsenatis]MDR6967320.1 3-oxoacyl-[acyl-carrier protein] reductase [Flavobacterium arsenatis]
MNTLKEKVIIVTGSSKGIGATIAKTLASKGATLVINYATSKADADNVVAEIINSGGNAIAIKADVSKTEEVKHLFEATINHFGKVDILINNAGIAIYKLIKDTTDEDFDRIFNINVKGTFNTMREASIRLADGGRIINFSSSVTRLMLPTYGTYSATKASVEQLTKVFAKEIGNRNITVNSVSPGPVNTELFTQGKTDETIARLASMSAFNRIGETDDIANVIAFLISDEAQWITAQNIGVNGGFA